MTPIVANLRIGFFVSLGIMALSLAACGGGSGIIIPPKASPSPTASPTPTPTPTVAPAAVATSVALATTAPGATAAPVTVPAPTGYTESVSLPITNAAPNAKVAIVNSVTAPTVSQIPALSFSRSAALSLRGALDTSTFNAIYYSVANPSVNVTVGGPASQ